MKKNLFTAVTVAFMTASFAQTTHPAKTQKRRTAQASQQKVAATTYHCPMKCENDKKYSEAGKCGKCGMDLVKVSN